ncbi:MAG: hypothetical protein ACJ8DD_19905, partial [Microvirga sp.]
MPAPRVLISDALSPAAVQIFKDRGIEVDFQPDLGKDKDKLAAIIGEYDGLAIRSATKVTAKILDQAKNLKVIGRAGIGVDNVDAPAATARGVIVMNTPFGTSTTQPESSEPVPSANRSRTMTASVMRLHRAPSNGKVSFRAEASFASRCSRRSLRAQWSRVLTVSGRISSCAAVSSML